jgi:hypothetical protein
VTTNVPKPTFGPNGFIAPTEADIFGGVFADINAAFGGNLNPDPDTPQGQLATSETAVVGFCNDTFLYYTNQVDPAYAEGRMQDAIGRIYFLERNPAEPTVVQANCSGAQGTIIPVGATAKSADGNTYICTSDGTIPAGGVVTLPFECLTPGPIVCPPNSLTTIYRAIPGWDTITNPAEGILGRYVESRAEFEGRREASVALNALGTLPAIRATVLNVPNVLDAYVTENPTNAPVTRGGVTLAANSLYVAVAGGATAAVAKAIWSKKMPGCAYNGTTTVTVVDDNSGYNLPYPTYSVSFTIATPTAVKFEVSIASSIYVPADATALIQNAIIAAFGGNDGGPRAKIGSLILASRYYACVALLGPWAQIVSIKVGTTTATLDDVLMNIDQAPTISAGDITVVEV